MSMSYSPANFNSSLSPYEQTQIFSWNAQELSERGYELFPVDDQNAVLLKQLEATIENIKRFFWDRFQSVGIDNKGKIPPFFIHFDGNNAFYSPSSIENAEYFAFNDAYVSSPEVVAHEFTHGIIENTNPLGNAGMAGAINESIADVVGIVFKRSLTDKYGRRMCTDWKIGTLRDLSLQIKMEEFNSDLTPRDDNDMGHVHDNSRILSHVFYLAASELEKFDQGNQQLLSIWIKAVLSLENNEKNFKGFINKTVQVGLEKGGYPFRTAIIQAWSEVGVQFT